jgi:3-oxoadipate enol-lactonase
VIALVGDTEIGYDDIGSGLPVVFIHAFPLNRTMWEPPIGARVAECRCIAIDFRGFGDSAASPPYSVDQYADDVAGVLDALQIERAVFVGLSLGGYVAFSLWRRHRHRVRGLVFADTRASADVVETIARRRELIKVAQTQGSAAVANMQIAGLMGKTTRDKRHDLYDAAHRSMSQAPVEAIVGALEAMIDRADSTETLATIDVPTLIIVGEEDVLTPPKEAKGIQAGIAGSRLEILQQAGHLSNVERPASFNTVVSEFLGGLLYS